MVARLNISEIERYLTVDRAFLLIVLVGLTNFALYPFAMFGPNSEAELGGDFVAFWSVARETIAGNMIDLYPNSGLIDAIAEHRPTAVEEASGLTWQYPPHTTLALAPFGLMAFPVAYITWMLLGLVAYAASLTLIGARGPALIALMATSIVFTAVITGQNGLFTAALMIVAVTWADRRPILAGLAAAALTIKPQLGFLLPLAYLTGRCWRSFITASIASCLLWGASFLVAGAKAWQAFLQSITEVSASVENGIMPLYKMVTIFSALRLGGLSPELATGISVVLGILMAAGVVWVWHKTSDSGLRLMAVSCAALLITPYAFYYELTIPLAGLFVLALRGHKTGWLAGERLIMLGMIFISIKTPGSEISNGVSLSFLFLFCASGLITRRIFTELIGTRINGLSKDMARRIEASPL
ncbi:MAG: glycosyltransferase family 87 protein [Pseudomonadota bacterium]